MSAKTADKVIAEIEKDAKASAKEALRAYEPFTYHGKNLEDLTLVGLGKTHSQTLTEINKRCKAMFDYCLRNDLVMTDAHMALVLGTVKTTLIRWRQGKDLGCGTGKAKGGVNRVPTQEDLQFVKDRAALLTKWHNMAEMRSLDKVSRTNSNASGATFLVKSSFGLFDTPQNNAPQSSGIHVENLILRAEQLEKAGLAKVK